MAKSNTFTCTVITPERKLLEVDATFAAFTAHDGEMGVLPGRAPLICKLGIGEVRVETPQRKYVFFIDEGFAQVLNNRLSILTESAGEVGELDRKAAEKALEEARAMPITDDASFAARARAFARARAQLRLTASDS